MIAAFLHQPTPVDCAIHNFADCVNHNFADCVNHDFADCAIHNFADCAIHNFADCAIHDFADCVNHDFADCVNHDFADCAIVTCDVILLPFAGAHCIGRCHPDRSGFVNPWTNAPTTFSNLYFTVSELLRVLLLLLLSFFLKLFFLIGLGPISLNLGSTF